VNAVRTTLTSQILLRAELAPQQPADLFVPTQREALDVEPEPGPPAGGARARSRGLRPIAITAVLLSGLLGAVTIAAFPTVSSHDAPPAASEQPLDTGHAAIGVEPPPR
jgi:hypothetical protein